MWICGEISGGGNGQFAGGPAVHSLERVEGAVVGALGLGAEAEVDAESGFLFLDEGLGDSGLAVAVVAADVSPEFAVDAAGPLEFPVGTGELLDQDSFVGVLG